jgi:hypothetical protein
MLTHNNDPEMEKAAADAKMRYPGKPGRYYRAREAYRFYLGEMVKSFGNQREACLKLGKIFDVDERHIRRVHTINEECPELFELIETPENRFNVEFADQILLSPIKGKLLKILWKLTTPGDRHNFIQSVELKHVDNGK